MRAMKKFLLVAALVYAAGCGSKADNAIGELEGFKTRMCECKDKACGDEVQKDMKEWKTKMKDSDVKKSDLSEDQKAKAKDVGMEMMKCAMALK